MIWDSTADHAQQLFFLADDGQNGGQQDPHFGIVKISVGDSHVLARDQALDLPDFTSQPSWRMIDGINREGYTKLYTRFGRMGAKSDGR